METCSAVTWEIIPMSPKYRYWVDYPITIKSLLWTKQKKKKFARDKFASFYAKELDRVITACTHWSNWGLSSPQPPCPERMKKTIITQRLHPLAEEIIMHYSHGLIRTMDSESKQQKNWGNSIKAGYSLGDSRRDFISTNFLISCTQTGLGWLWRYKSADGAQKVFTHCYKSYNCE